MKKQVFLNHEKGCLVPHPVFPLVSVLFLRPVPLQGNLSNFDLIMESDMGTFAPVALQFSGSGAAQKVRGRADDPAEGPVRSPQALQLVRMVTDHGRSGETIGPHPHN